MIRDIKYLYVAIKDNKVIVSETNLKNFLIAFNKIESNCRNYDSFHREFKKSKILHFLNEKEEIYFIQKLL